ncbi:MAG: CCA tRNA nucleotidyltransferase [Erythrobacter sp.]
MLHDLARADWTQRAGLAELAAALGAPNIRWVGGAVRDGLLGIAVHDVDCATTLTPDQVMLACDQARIRTVPTGIEHGTITAILDDGPIEITTLRRDVATDGRRATIAYASEWREDAARRDFTINALYADPVTLEISDYFGGLDDLAARRVRFIGSAADRIAEDHLRILRYYRFQARFGAALDAEAEAACAAMAHTLKGLSRERIAGELLALLALGDPHGVAARMHGHGVLQVILPEAGAAELAALGALIAHEAAEGFAPDAIRRLAALLPADPALAEQVAARLRLSKAQRQRLLNAARRSPDDAKTPRGLAYYCGLAPAQDRLLLNGAPTASLAGWQPPAFPLKGGELVARGISAGPQVAQILKSVEARWVAADFPPREWIEEILGEELAKISPAG